MVLRAINNFKSDLGRLRKSVDEHGVKIEALTQAKQRNAGKENVKEQNSRDQKQGKFAGAAVKGKGKGKQTKVAPPYKPTIQEVRSDSESEEELDLIEAYIALVIKAPVKPFGFEAMHAQNCIDTQEGNWNKSSRPTLGATVQTSAFASMCLADDDLVGDQHSSGGLVS